MKRANPRWRDAVVRLQVGINTRWPPHDDPRWTVTADDRVRLGVVLDATLTAKSAEAVGAAILAAFGVARVRGRPSLARTASELEGLRERVYAEHLLSMSVSVPLVEILDAIAAGGTAGAVGQRVLALFGARRGRGRPRDLAAEAAADLAWNLYRLGTPIREIADATGWTIGSVERFLNPLIAAHGSVRPRQPTKQPPKRPR